MMKQLQEQSMCYLRNSLYHKYGTGHERPVFAKIIPELIKEYPLVLSTTFSSRINFDNDTVFDYVIMDEASQISAETGALALMCAKNAVIVGDSMQLPNVATDEDRQLLQKVATLTNDTTARRIVSCSLFVKSFPMHRKHCSESTIVAIQRLSISATKSSMVAS